MNRRVVITGLGTINALGANVEATWEKVLRGESGIRTIPAFQEAGLKSHFGGEASEFDPNELFGRREARRMDRVQHLALAATGQALADANLEGYREGQRVGVVLGSGIGGVGALVENATTMLERGAGRVSPFFVPMLLPDSAAGMIAITYGFRGPNMNIATACASANNAMGEAAQMIRRGAADVVITGGTEAALAPLIIAGFANMGALSARNDHPAGASRPFDKERDGFVPAEGAAILIFEEREHALARGARIYGEFLGYGSSADAYHISSPDENGEGAVMSMQWALEDAGLEPAAIDYINAHGTSTLLNDKTETLAIKRVFGEQAYGVPISSTKALHGHLLGAAGALEALLVMKAMQAHTIPGTYNYETPDPECDLDYVPNENRPGMINCVMSNSFGFGGHNATIILGRAD